MGKRVAVLVVACAVAACGGGGGSGANPATTATFDYASGGAPVAATPPLSAMSALSTVETGSAGSPELAFSVGGSLFSAADEVLGASGVFFAASGSPRAESATRTGLSMLRQARSGMLFDADGVLFPDACVTIANATVTFDGCRQTETWPDGTSFTYTLDGHVSGAPGSATWDLTLGMGMTDADFRITAGIHDRGSFAVTPTTAKGLEEATLRATASAGGRSETIALAQAAALDVSLAPATDCATRIVGGTFEAKRIWTQKPSELTGPEYQNRGVKLTWTGCGTATMQTAVR